MTSESLKKGNELSFEIKQLKLEIHEYERMSKYLDSNNVPEDHKLVIIGVYSLKITKSDLQKVYSQKLEELNQLLKSKQLEFEKL